MVRRIEVSCDLMGRCLQVLRARPELMVLSLLGILAGLLLMASFAGPMLAAGLEPFPRGGNVDPVHYVIVALFYLGGTFVMVLSHAAVIAAALEHMRGGRLSVRDALAAAAGRWRQLAGWTLVAGTVGYLLRLVQSRSNLLGRIATGLVGMGWTVATYLAVPVMVVEGIGPLEGIQRSTALVRRTWGEQLVTTLSFGYVFSLLSTPAILIVLAYLLTWGALFPLPVTLIAVAYLFGLFLVSTTLGSILQAAIYLHAGGNPMPRPFDDNVLATVLRAPR
jgi:hypothetical protein